MEDVNDQRTQEWDLFFSGIDLTKQRSQIKTDLEELY